MLTITELKQEAYGNWEVLCLERGVYSPGPNSLDLPKTEAERLPITNTAFKDEVRQRFGDLRRRSTWESAAIWFAAQGMAQSYLEPYQIVGYLVSDTYLNDPIRRHYGDRLIEALLQFPEVIDIVRRGLEQVYREADYQEERSLVEQFIQTGHQLPAQLALPVMA